jgi:hypothetical protein
VQLVLLVRAWTRQDQLSAVRDGEDIDERSLRSSSHTPWSRAATCRWMWQCVLLLLTCLLDPLSCLLACFLHPLPTWASPWRAKRVTGSWMEEEEVMEQARKWIQQAPWLQQTRQAPFLCQQHLGWSSSRGQRILQTCRVCACTRGGESFAESVAVMASASTASVRVCHPSSVHALRVTVFVLRVCLHASYLVSR